MMLARLRLAFFTLAFVGWIAWLGYAVMQRGNAIVVSRAQLLAASDIVVATVETDSKNLPKPEVKILEVYRGRLQPGTQITINNLPGALAPAEVPEGFHAFTPGSYLIPLVQVSEKLYRVAGLPRSPGLEATAPERPVVYPWSDAIESQLRSFAVLKKNEPAD